MRSFLVLLLLALTVFAVHGLSGQELDALTALGNRFKILTTASPPWRLDAIDTACNNPPFYGLTCTDEADPHVVGMYGLTPPVNFFRRFLASSSHIHPVIADTLFFSLF